MTIKVFVYGTLKKGYGNHGCLGKSPNLLKADSLQNAVMVDLGAFPGIIPGTGIVHGELYEVIPSVMSRLDLLEGHPNFYTRTKVTTTSGEHCWTYFLSAKTQKQVADAGRSYPIIESGVWGNGC